VRGEKAWGTTKKRKKNAGRIRTKRHSRTLTSIESINRKAEKQPCLFTKGRVGGRNFVPEKRQKEGWGKIRGDEGGQGSRGAPGEREELTQKLGKSGKEP